MEEPIKGSLGVASTLQLTEKAQGSDKESKNLLKYREILAVILKYTVEEYQDYTVAEVMGFIEEDSITDQREVSRGRTNTQIEGSATEFPELNEKTSYFDLNFLARNPRLSSLTLLVNLHIDLESCLAKEATDGMFNLHEWFYQDGVEAGVEQGIKQGIEALILENLEEHVPEERIITKLQRFFKLSEEKATEYFEKYAIVEFR